MLLVQENVAALGRRTAGVPKTGFHTCLQQNRCGIFCYQHSAHARNLYVTVRWRLQQLVREQLSRLDSGPSENTNHTIQIQMCPSFISPFYLNGLNLTCPCIIGPVRQWPMEDEWREKGEGGRDSWSPAAHCLYLTIQIKHGLTAVVAEPLFVILSDVQGTTRRRTAKESDADR